MDVTNIAVLRGIVTSEPRRRELRSGSVVINIEVTTVVGAHRRSVPIAVYDQDVAVQVGDDVVVRGSVVRRFFRASGATASRTEVVADRIVPASNRRRVARLLDDVAGRVAGLADVAS